jgi:hypothetical protein
MILPRLFVEDGDHSRWQGYDGPSRLHVRLFFYTHSDVSDKIVTEADLYEKR